MEPAAAAACSAATPTASAGPSRCKRRGKLLYETDSSFLSMDGAAAGSGGRKFSPYSHGRHDADKGQLGASIQFDLVPKATVGGGGGSVPGRGRLITQPVTHYYGAGLGLSDGRGIDYHHKPDAVELLRRRHAEAHPVRLDRSGAGPSDLRHCYMCETRESVRSWLYWPPRAVRTTASRPTTASAVPAGRPWPTAAWSSRSTASVAAGWPTSARTARAVQMGAVGLLWTCLSQACSPSAYNQWRRRGTDTHPCAAWQVDKSEVRLRRTITEEKDIFTLDKKHITWVGASWVPYSPARQRAVGLTGAVSSFPPQQVRGQQPTGERGV
jgi:hypothetical protein